MIKRHIFRRSQFKKCSAALGAMLLSVTIGVGATVNVPDKPIFLGNDVQANIFFALDDSGSMDWEVTMSNGALTAHASEANSGNLDFSPNDNREDRRLCVGYNVMAYDPALKYVPWDGVDSNGNPYADQSISAAARDPYVAGGTTTNLVDADGTGYATVFGAWVDGFGGNPADGVYQSGECPTTTVTGDYTTRIAGFTDARWVFVDTLSAAQQTNFANWYSYYRKREYVLKRAVSALIVKSNQRMGLATLHDNNSVGTAVADMTNATAKSALIDKLFQINSTGGTPLRALLDNTGKYFDQTDSGDSLHSALGITTGSPILPVDQGGQCQQNFAVLFSDGYWNGSAPSVGNTDEDGAGPWDGGPHTDTYSNTLADVAMKYYETDLSPLPNSVAVLAGVDENPAQHLVTYAVSFGLDGKLSTAPADHDAATPPPPWPLPSANAQTTIDDMRHAAFNSRGLYLSGRKPQELIDTMNDALTDIADRTGTASAVVATAQSVQTNTLIFQSSFNTEGWKGDLIALRFLSSGTIGAEQWRAAAAMPAEPQRNIVTWVNDGVVTGADFAWANLTAAQQTDIGSEPILNYVRGVRSDELQNGGSMRNRDSLLGDIIHSPPTAVTKTQASPPYQTLPGAEGSTFNAFLASKASRTDMVYVGANDGMLHGFRTSDGKELFAFVPQATFPTLASLIDPAYTHKFYVDGPLRATDAYVSGNWKSVLVGALGRGGRSVFALDVSAPSTFSASDVMWEYSDTDLGHVIGKMQVVRLNNGAWALITGNGYNSTNERAYLYVIDLATGALIKKFDTGAGSAANTNGLSAPLVVDINGDFTSDYVYAGDMLGNLWKFDLTDPSPANWSIALGGTPLYQAIAPDSSRQVITTKPSIVAHPNGGFVILFGTGRFFATGDDLAQTPAHVDTFYGILDAGSIVASVGSRPLPTAGTQPNAVLQPQSIIEEDTETFGTEVKTTRTLSQNNVNYPTQKGWYMDLVSPVNGAEGERLVADPVVSITANNKPLILFNTFRPLGGCEKIGGFSALMAFDPISGGRTEFAVFDLNGDGEFDNGDAQSDGSGGVNHDNGLIGAPTITPPSIIASQDGTVNHAITTALDGDSEVNDINAAAQTLGRQSWRELQ